MATVPTGLSLTPVRIIKNIWCKILKFKATLKFSTEKMYEICVLYSKYIHTCSVLIRIYIFTYSGLTAEVNERTNERSKMQTTEISLFFKVVASCKLFYHKNNEDITEELGITGTAH
jgi:hypothetical protein